MKTARSKFSAIALVVALVSAIGSSVFADQFHPVCVTKHHDCGQTPTMTSCCCGDQGNASGQGGPTESRVQVSADFCAGSEALVTALVHDMHRAMVRPLTSPSRAGPLDLPTLFASLLI